MPVSGFAVMILVAASATTGVQSLEVIGGPIPPGNYHTGHNYFTGRVPDTGGAALFADQDDNGWQVVNAWQHIAVNQQILLTQIQTLAGRYLGYTYEEWDAHYSQFTPHDWAILAEEEQWDPRWSRGQWIQFFNQWSRASWAAWMLRWMIQQNLLRQQQDGPAQQ